MGKSETAKMFAAEGIPVFDADAAVHRLQAKGGRALPAIEKAFPGTVQGGVLDRTKLGAIVFADEAAKKRLEAIIHPMVAEERIGFFEEAKAKSAPFVVLDIPLLFETSGDKACHKVVVVSAPLEVQRERVLARPGMSAEKFEAIVAKQTPDAEKRARADYLIESDKGLEHARARVREIVAELKKEAN
jgi:dephospho-CoA kinase